MTADRFFRIAFICGGAVVLDHLTALFNPFTADLIKALHFAILV